MINNKLIGLTGFARSGKDTFFLRSSNYLKDKGEMAIRFAFADVLKKECDSLLMLNTGISAFTCIPEEKELIRPLLVTYGTHIRRRLDPDCWINEIKRDVFKKISQGYYVFITDVRYANEAKWIQSQGGLIFNIEREGVGPANKEEMDESKLIKMLTNGRVRWPTFGDDEIFLCDKYVKNVIDRDFDQIFEKEFSF
jgi:hypothetical protein